MLVLTRKFDEKIILSWENQTITILVCGTQGDRVRLGFEAPPEVLIHREEVHNEIQSQGERKKQDG